MKAKRRLQLVALFALLCPLINPSYAMAEDLPGYGKYRSNFFLSDGSTQILCVVDEVLEAHTMYLTDGSEATVLLLRVNDEVGDRFCLPVLLMDISGQIYYQQTADWIMEAKLFFADFDGDGADDILAVTDYGACGGFGAYDWSVYKLSPEGIILLYDGGSFDDNWDFSNFQAIPQPGWQFEVHHEILPFSVTFPLPANHETMRFFDDKGIPKPEFSSGFDDEEYPIMAVDPCYMIYPVPQEVGPAFLGVAQYCYTGSHNGSYVGSAHTLLRFNTQKGRFEEVDAAFTTPDAEDFRPPWAHSMTDWFMDLQGHE